MDPVELPVPPSVNSIWRTVRVKSGARVTLSRAYRGWLDIAILKLRMGMPKIAPDAYPVAVRVTILRGRGWRKGRDGDNEGAA